MAQIKQVGIGRKSSGTIDGITYYTRNGKTFARSTPTMPASAYNNPDAKVRQAIFKMVQMHMKLHLRTIRQTITAKNGSPSNRYYSLNGKALSLALRMLAEQMVDGEVVTIDDVEQAISDYAAANPKSIKIASKSGYGEVFLTGAWPQTITLYANGGDSTVIIIVAENGSTTTINPDGTSVVIANDDSGSTDSGNQGTGGSGSNSNPSNPTSSVAAPTISGQTPFANTSEVTLSAESGASVYYTVDGSTPTTESTPYSAPFTLNSTTVVKAIAIKDGVSSEVATKNFTKSSGNQDD
jgi:hypothetical protein